MHHQILLDDVHGRRSVRDVLGCGGPGRLGLRTDKGSHTGASPRSAPLPYRVAAVTSAGGKPQYLLEGVNGSCIRLSRTAYFALSRTDAGEPGQDVARKLGLVLGREVSAAQVAAAYAQVRGQVDAIAGRSGRPTQFGLWFRCRVLPSAAVHRLTRRLSALLHPAVASGLAIGAVLAAYLPLAVVPGRTAGRTALPTMMDANAFLPMLGLFALSMVAQELGQASASARYGVPARDIGFGASAVFILGLFTLVPVLKFDGYWLLTDLLGVDNLSRQYLTMIAVRVGLALPDLTASYADSITGLIRDLYLPPHKPAPGRLSAILGPTYLLLGVLMAVVTLGRRAGGALRRRLGTGTG